MLVQANEICTLIIPDGKGITRGFVREGCKEITTWISCERELVTSITGFDKQIPAKENIQAIGRFELSGLLHKDLHYLYDHFPEMNIVGRRILNNTIAMPKKERSLHVFTEATSKYKYILLPPTATCSIAFL